MLEIFLYLTFLEVRKTYVLKFNLLSFIGRVRPDFIINKIIGSDPPCIFKELPLRFQISFQAKASTLRGRRSLRSICFPCSYSPSGNKQQLSARNQAMGFTFNFAQGSEHSKTNFFDRLGEWWVYTVCIIKKRTQACIFSFALLFVLHNFNLYQCTRSFSFGGWSSMASSSTGGNSSDHSRKNKTVTLSLLSLPCTAQQLKLSKIINTVQ